jgi:hypothetical protein
MLRDLRAGACFGLRAFARADWEPPWQISGSGRKLFGLLQKPSGSVGALIGARDPGGDGGQAGAPVPAPLPLAVLAG